MGRLTRDPELRYSNKGEEQTAICNYTLAVDRRQRNQDGSTPADFIPCTAFGRAAEFAEKYFTQGLRVLVTGRIQTGSYTDKDGVKRYSTDIVCERASFVDSRAEESRSHTATVGAYQPMPEGADMQPVDDNLPF